MSTIGSQGAVTAPIDSERAQLEALRNEIARLQIVNARERERARVAEEQLLRVHRSVRAAQQSAKAAKAKRNTIIENAQRVASDLVRQAQLEADQIRGQAGSGEQPRSTSAPVRPSPFERLSKDDPSLDHRLDEYLQTDLEPDASRDWILGDRSA